MEQSSDKLGVIDLVGKSLILSSALGIFPEFWSVLVGLLKMMRLPSPKVLFDVSSKFLSQHKQSGKLIDEADETSPATFTDKIISLQSKGKMNDWDALSVCVNNVIAGSDTTAISLNSAIYHIYKDSRILQTLRAELDSGMRQGQVSDPITFAEAQKLPYLQAVINEALRVHPAVGVPLLRDVPQGGADIDGYFFPEGVSLMLRQTALREQIFANKRQDRSWGQCLDFELQQRCLRSWRRMFSPGKVVWKLNRYDKQRHKSICGEWTQTQPVYLRDRSYWFGCV